MEIKTLFVLIDGLGEGGVEQFENKTILQYFDFPNLDYLASIGLNGLLDSVETGKACGSDTAHMSLFGLNPFEHYKGRGSFETLGAGIDLIPGDIAFKCNFSTMDENRVVFSRRCDRQFHEWGIDIAKEIDGIKIPQHENHIVKVKYATEHRVGLRVRGPGLAHTVGDTDPCVDGKKLKVSVASEDNAESHFTANLVNQLQEALINFLENHPINIQRKKEGKKYTNVLTLRGCGSRINCETLEQKYGLKGYIIAPTAVISGIGQTFGLDRITGIEGATGDAYTNLTNKAMKAVEVLLNQDYNFGFLHIKGYDDLAHDMKVQERAEFLKKVDEMMQLVIQQLTKSQTRCLVVVTGDHTTTCYTGDHSYEPVPFVIAPVNFEFDKSKHKDGVTKLDEISSSRGMLGRFSGNQVLNLILKLKNEYIQ